MKKCRWLAAFVLLCLLCVSTISVHAGQSDSDEIAARKEKAEKLGLSAWIDEEGYLVDAFYEGKSDRELSEMGVDGLVRTLSEEELEAYVSNLKDGIEIYTVTEYYKISQINPDTGNYLYTGFFEVDGKLAFCIERSVTTPAKGAPTGEKVLVTNEDLRKVLWYGYEGPEDCGYTYVETALAAGEANGDGDNSLGRKVLAEIRQKDAPPSSFYVWQVETNGGQTQDLAYYEYDPEGYGQVVKKSGNSALTSGNSNYSLEGAVFGVYLEKTCVTEMGRITTDASGVSGTITLPSSTYYVKELKAPKGYQLNTQVHTLTIRSGEKTTLTVADTPLTAAPEDIVQKVDAKTKENVAQGTGTLEGARFAVKYYQEKYQEGVDPKDEGKTPVRQWVFQTDEEGKITFQEAYKVSGDSFWKDSSGKIVLPLGTITIQEITSSDGYRVNPRVFVYPLTSGEQLPVTTVEETVVELTLMKYQEDTLNPLEGAVFEHVNPDGTIEQLETDENGQIVWKGLRRGTHEIREIDSAEGYRDNLNIITFDVTEENEIVVTSNADETYGEIRTTVDETGNLLIEVENKVGFRLPETGCAGASALSVLGILFIFAALRSKKGRSA